MLVGESKLYCGVLIWEQKDRWNEKTSQTIDYAVEEINKSLSNPEKIKKWALLVNNLNIENGGLTPNPKPKRNFLTERCQKVINVIYEGPVPDGYIHIGRVNKPE